MDEKREVMKIDIGADGSKTVNMNCPSNSHKTRIEKKEEKKVEKVVKGTVIIRKKSWTKRFMESFIGNDINSVGGYILYDVLIPAAKSTIADMVKGGIEMLMYPDRKGSNMSRDRGRSFVSYNNYSSNRQDDRREFSNRDRARHNFDEIAFKSRGDAAEVISRLVEQIIEYGQATVADLYDLVGITGEFTDNKYGWIDLRSASVSRARDGYLLILPKPILLI